MEIKKNWSLFVYCKTFWYWVILFSSKSFVIIQKVFCDSYDKLMYEQGDFVA